MQVFVDYLAILNWWAVLVAAAAAFASGSIWYAQSVFGKQWQKSVGLTNKQIKSSNMTSILAVSFVTVLVSAIAVGLLIEVLALETFYQGALFGVMLAVGILGANKLMQTKFERRPNTYWLISLGADMVSFAIMGGILAIWP